MPPKRRRKFHGLYYHSSPPKVLNMNGPSTTNSSNKSGEDNSGVKEVFVYKPANIRTWIHDKDLGKLTRVLWTGQGNRLRAEASTHPKVRKFLETVPYVLNVIKDVHQAVVDNNLEMLQAKTEPPVPPSLITTKDSNGLTVMHKAAGMAHTMILEYLLKIWPDGVVERDGSGKTPLHWAASAKNNIRSYNLLVLAGANEEVLDNRMKTPAYYKNKSNDIDRSLLTVLPDAPRVPSDHLLDWNDIVDDIGSLAKTDESINNNGSARKSFGRSSSELLGNGINLLTARSKVSNDINDTSEFSNLLDGDIDDGNGEFSIEEQAVLAAIEDQKLYKTKEKMQKMQIISPSHNKLNDNLRDEIEINDRSLKNLKSDHDDILNEDSTVNTVEPLPKISKTSSSEEGLEEDENFDKTDGKTAEENQENENTRNNDNPSAEVSDNEDNDDTNETVIDEKEQDDLKTESKEDAENAPEGNQNSDGNGADEDEIVDNAVNNALEIDEDAELENENQNDEQDDNDNLEKSNEIENEEEDDDDDQVTATDNIKNNVNDNRKSTIRDYHIDENHNAVVTNGHHRPDHLSESSKKTGGDSRNNNNKINNNSSLSPAMEIEGVVQGEPDNNQVQSQSEGHDDNETDEESRIKTIVDSGDMEQLAALVLNGEGNKLVGKKSHLPEIQAFLDNVTAYMHKIRRVHVAAKEGNLRDLQAALDRRKFSIAKDSISPNGSSALHVATVFGHADIVRYLGGRFPETTTIVDDDGRTALHYAATIKDNGHFYNLLTHLGSNPKAIDQLGKTPEFYLNYEQSKDILTHRKLLKIFGADETLEDEMLRDQASNNKHRSLQIPTFKTEQGRYLADALGDPLIQGLTEIAEKRPSDPISYLATFLKKFSKTHQTAGISAASSSQSSAQSNRSYTRPSSRQQSQIASSSLTAVTKTASDYQQPGHQNDTYYAQQNGGGGNSSSDELEYTTSSEDRDEHGQSMLHFACARAHSRNALYNLIEESNINVAYRDELYRTARDVSLQANQPKNAKEIDRYVLALAARGDLTTFEALLLGGYDHILDLVDDTAATIMDVARTRGHHELSRFLDTIQIFEETREDLHQAIRSGNSDKIYELTAMADGGRLTKAKNYYGRCALHIAVLKENEEHVEYFASNFKGALRIRDNLERTPLHYAMGINSVESISRILIKNGAKRIAKDLKGRQPSYYFINKADILRLQEEEQDDN